MKKRINLEIKPCCHNCQLNEFGHCEYSFAEINPCRVWEPSKDWFRRKLKAAERKLTKEKK